MAGSAGLSARHALLQSGLVWFPHTTVTTHCHWDLLPPLSSLHVCIQNYKNTAGLNLLIAGNSFISFLLDDWKFCDRWSAGRPGELRLIIVVSHQLKISYGPLILVLVSGKLEGEGEGGGCMHISSDKESQCQPAASQT